MRSYSRFAGVVLVFFTSSSTLVGVEASPEDPAYLFALAQVQRFEGSYNQSLSAFQQAVELDPSEPFLRLEYAEFLFQLGRLNEAEEHAETARLAAPRNREALRLLGRINLRLAERSPSAMERAQGAFEELRRLDPQDIDVRVTLGRLYLTLSQSAAAAAVLREARELRPGDRLIVSLLIEALGNLSDAPGVMEELNSIVEEDPGFLQPRLVLSQALSRNGEESAVVELLEDAPEEVRANVDYLRQLAFAYYRSGAFRESLTTAEEWLERRPGDTMGRYLRSLVLAALGRDEESEQVLAGLLEENPDSLEFALALAEIIERRGRRHEAAQLLLQLTERLEMDQRIDDRRRALASLVDLHARAGDWDEILKLSERLSEERWPADDSLRLLGSRALEELGRSEEALEKLEKLAKVPGLENQVSARQATILFGLGRTKEAERILNRLSSSEDLRVLMLAAEVLHEVELFDRAVPVLQKAVRMEPENLDVMFWLGASFERSGRLAEAESEFRRLLDIDGDFAPALNYLGYMWTEKGENLEEALELVLRAVALEPNNGAYVDSLGWVYYQSGRYEEARAHLERAASLVGNDAVVYEHLGDAYVAVGDPDQAEVAYRKALELESENRSEVRRKLTDLRNQ
jgi:tetratricopeptide (TPR) repeat protein